MIYTFVNIHPIISYPCIQLRMVYGLVFKFITFYKQCYLSILQYLRCINQEICWAILASNGSPQYGKVVEYLYRYHYFDSLKYTLLQILWPNFLGHFDWLVIEKNYFLDVRNNFIFIHVNCLFSNVQVSNFMILLKVISNI